MLTLEQIRRKQNKQVQLDKDTYKLYKINNSVPLLSKIIRNHNIKLIKWISINKRLSEIEYNELLDKFLKVNYYSPSIK